MFLKHCQEQRTTTNSSSCSDPKVFPSQQAKLTLKKKKRVNKSKHPNISKCHYRPSLPLDGAQTLNHLPQEQEAEELKHVAFEQLFHKIA